MVARDEILIKKLLVFVLLLAAVLRIYGLDRLGLWADELWVVMDSSQGSLWDMLLSIHQKDNHPPGHYLLSRYSQALIGSSDFAIRLPSALAGILLVAMTFVAGRKHLSPEAAVLAAALVAGSYQAIYYSQEARPNIFIALLSLLSLHYFRALVLENDVRRKNFYAFWAFASLNAYFHYVGLIFIFSLFLIYLGALIFHRNKNFLMLGCKIFIPVLLLYMPWLPGMYHDLVASPPEYWHRVPTYNTLKNSFSYLFGPGDLQIYIYAVIFITIPFWILAVHSKKSWRIKYGYNGKLLGLLWLLMVLPVAFFYIKSIYSQPVYNHRHFLHAIPIMSLLTGAVLSKCLSLTSGKKRSGLLILVMGIIILYQWIINNHYALYRANHFKQDYRESAKLVANKLSASEENGTFIITNSRFFDHYLNYFSHGMLRSSLLIYSPWGDDNKPDILSTMNPGAVFYYLEEPAIPAANKMITPMDEFLAKHYRVLCRSKLIKTQVILFENITPLEEMAVDWEELPDCTIEK